MKYRRMILFTVLFSLGALLSACGTDVAPSNELADDLPAGWVAVENPGELATAAISDEYWFCFYLDADYQGPAAYCTEDESVEGLTSGIFKLDRLPEVLNDSISSVQLRPGLTLELFTDAVRQGNSLTLTADSNYIGDEFNDKISSYIVTVP